MSKAARRANRKISNKGHAERECFYPGCNRRSATQYNCRLCDFVVKFCSLHVLEARAEIKRHCWRKHFFRTLWEKLKGNLED